MISKILAPVSGVNEDGTTLAVAAEVAKHFHAHVEVASAAGGIPRGSVRRAKPRSAAARSGQAAIASKAPAGSAEALRGIFETWRGRHRLRVHSERLHRGLASASWVPLGGPPEEELPHRARLSDLVCLGRRRGGQGAAGLSPLEAMLFTSGRPVVLMPAVDGAEAPSILGEPAVVGWNGSVEAARAVTGALPFLRISAEVEVVSVGEESVNVMEAHELARYLAWHGVRVRAAGIARKDWTGGDFVAVATGRGAGLLVMGAHRRGDTGALGSATRHVLEHMPMPVILTA